MVTDAVHSTGYLGVARRKVSTKEQAFCKEHLAISNLVR
jgi:hypothetical protein